MKLEWATSLFRSIQHQAILYYTEGVGEVYLLTECERNVCIVSGNPELFPHWHGFQILCPLSKTLRQWGNSIVNLGGGNFIGHGGLAEY